VGAGETDIEMGAAELTMQKFCEFCGTKYPTFRHKQRYCKAACRILSRRKPDAKVQPVNIKRRKDWAVK
jgi:hypothetical protein